MELPPPDAPQIPSGEYQGLPEPPGGEMREAPDQAEDPGFSGVDERMALRWAFQHLMPHLFGRQNPADRGGAGGDTMSYQEVS